MSNKILDFTDPNESLYRAVRNNPNEYDITQNKPTLAAFSPVSKEDYQMSVDRGTLITPSQSVELHARIVPLRNFHEIWELTVGEAQIEVDAVTRDDISTAPPKMNHDPTEQNKSHSLVNCSHLTDHGKVRKLYAKYWLKCAIEKGAKGSINELQRVDSNISSEEIMTQPKFPEESVDFNSLRSN